MRMIRLLLHLVLTAFAARGLSAEGRPNVVVILTDDQGYGEIASHGNPVIRTPNLDALRAESVRLTDFHVDPTCSPTRSALMTGRYSTRTGVWHTINGRSMMDSSELTLAEVFKANGYDTAFFGKWHLGDNHPCRPDDQGYDHVVWHHGGGLDNAPADWGGDYYDDTVTVNGKRVKSEGYCTDYWFNEAIDHIKGVREKPFFISIHTNAPHGPYIVPESYSKPYREAGLSETMAIFYGMITCIDDNIGRFRKSLEELGIADNTLILFMTDNGTAAGWINFASGDKYFNAGMRAWKGFAYDGGHRVPSFWHWPKGGLAGGRDVSRLSAHIDVLPTLVDLLDLRKPDGPPLDGVSLAPVLRDGKEAMPERSLFVHVQRQYLPPKWVESAVMTDRWRLVHGKELYDILADPGQDKDIASANPEIVSKLRADYEAWWKSLEPGMQRTVRYRLGGAENPMTLSSHDWLMETGEKDAVWHQSHVTRGEISNGPWAVDVAQAGTYEIGLHRWPPELGKPMGMIEARLRIGDSVETMKLEESATSATFRMDLKPGPAMLKGWLRSPGPQRAEIGAYFVTVRLLGKE